MVIYHQFKSIIYCKWTIKTQHLTQLSINNDLNMKWFGYDCLCSCSCSCSAKKIFRRNMHHEYSLRSLLLFLNDTHNINRTNSDQGAFSNQWRFYKSNRHAQIFENQLNKHTYFHCVRVWECVLIDSHRRVPILLDIFKWCEYTIRSLAEITFSPNYTIF